MFVQIIEDLNRRGIQTKRGKEWNKSSFNKLLSNERYIGIYRYKNIVHEHGFPEIVSPDLFYAVQKRMGEKPNARGNTMRRRSEFGTYLLTGKLICGKCGALMSGVSGVGRHGDRCFYYSCIRKKNEHACDKKNVRRDPVEMAVTTYLQQMLSDDELIDWMAEQAVAYQTLGRDDDEFDAVGKELKEATRKKENIIDAIADGMRTASMKAKLEELEKKEADLKARFAYLKQDRENDITKDMILSYLEMLRDGDVTDKGFQQLMIDSFLDKAIVYDDHLKLLFNVTKEHGEIDIPLEIEGKGDSEGTTAKGLFKLFAPPPNAFKSEPRFVFVNGIFGCVFGRGKDKE